MKYQVHIREQDNENRDDDQFHDRYTSNYFYSDNVCLHFSRKITL